MWGREPCVHVFPRVWELRHSPSAQRCRGCRASRGMCIAGPPGGWSRLLVAWALNSRKPRGWLLRLVPDGPLPSQASVFLLSRHPKSGGSLRSGLQEPAEGPLVASEALSPHPEIPRNLCGLRANPPHLDVCHSSTTHACRHLLLPTGEQRAYAAKTPEQAQRGGISVHPHPPFSWCCLAARAPGHCDAFSPPVPSAPHKHASPGLAATLGRGCYITT